MESVLVEIMHTNGPLNSIIINLQFLLASPYRLKRVKEKRNHKFLASNCRFHAASNVITDGQQIRMRPWPEVSRSFRQSLQVNSSYPILTHTLFTGTFPSHSALYNLTRCNSTSPFSQTESVSCKHPDRGTCPSHLKSGSKRLAGAWGCDTERARVTHHEL